MNDQATTSAASGLPGGEELVQRQLQHVGWAYALIFVLIFAFAWRTSAATKRLHERLDELERDSGQRR